MLPALLYCCKGHVAFGRVSPGNWQSGVLSVLQCLQQFLWAQIFRSFINIARGSLVCVKRKKGKKNQTKIPTIPNVFYYLFKQITWTSAHCSRAGDMQPAEVQQESIVSYLPLSHIAAQIYDLWTGIKWGEQVYFAEPDALKVPCLALHLIKIALPSLRKHPKERTWYLKSCRGWRLRVHYCKSYGKIKFIIFVIQCSRFQLKYVIHIHKVLLRQKKV